MSNMWNIFREHFREYFGQKRYRRNHGFPNITLMHEQPSLT